MLRLAAKTQLKDLADSHYECTVYTQSIFTYHYSMKAEHDIVTYICSMHSLSRFLAPPNRLDQKAIAYTIKLSESLLHIAGGCGVGKMLHSILRTYFLNGIFFIYPIMLMQYFWTVCNNADSIQVYVHT